MVKMQPEGPITIGYLSSNLNVGNGRLLWLGIQGQAETMGLSLITFGGLELNYPRPFYHHANQVYELVNRQRIDGLIIWASSLSAFIEPEEIRAFCEGYYPLPVVGIGMPLPGIPSVLLDSYHGMREAILHLVQVHGKRRLAFIRGPERHREAKERLRAYRDVVAEFDLDADPRLISPPCRWDQKDSYQAMRLLIEDRRIQFDGVVAVNDELAYGAMSCLRDRGIRIPEEAAIIGFDNGPIGRVCTPPLTTVPNRIRERGRQAVRMLLAKINGEEVPELVVLPTSVKVRQSCGCLDPYIAQASEPPEKITNLSRGADPEQLRSHIILQLQRAVTAEDSLLGWPERLFDAFQASLENQSQAPFLTELQGLLQSLMTTGIEIRGWQAALSELRRWMLPLEQGNPERLDRIESLIHQGRIMVGEIAARSQAHQDWLRSRQLNNLHRLRQVVSSAETLASLVEILARDLPELGIASGCLALYLDPASALDGARLALGFFQNSRLPEKEGQVFAPSIRLVPPPWLEGSEPVNLVVHPLNVGAEQLGFLVVDTSDFEISSHQVLGEQISSALNNVLLTEKNVQLYHQARKNQRLAEEADSLKSRFLSMVSHELLTPIVLLVGLSEMMLREGIGSRPPLPDTYRQDLTRIHASAQQLGSLVRDVLDLARSQLGQLTISPKPVRLEDVLKPVDLVSEQMANSKGLEWQVSIPEHLPLVMGDASRLQQVALNLVSNAVKFTAQGSVQMKVEVDNGMVEISISDTGLSVPLAEQEIIFDEFRQSERTVARGFGGLGIGLAICRQIIQLHGGEIGVQSSGEENSGSTFFFTLPVLPESVPQQRAEPCQTVLILTEQSQHSLPLLTHLEQQGFQVQVLDTVKNPDWLDDLLATQIGALVLDFSAAEKGWEIMEILKKNPATQDLPIIFYSLLQEQDSGSMLALDYLIKPVAAARLEEALRRYGLTSGEHDPPRTVLIVDDDPEILGMHTRLVEEHLPTCQVVCAANGRAALEMMLASTPDLVLLDLMMPELDGMAVLKAMQEDRRLQGIPVIVLTAQRLSEDEMKHLDQAVVSVLAKGIFSAEETLAHIEQALMRNKRLGSETQHLVRSVMAYIHGHYAETISRQELARYAGVSERHLNRCFLQETCMTPLTYLTRYRIQQAKQLLERGQLSVTQVLNRTGFSDSSHFARLFRREVGVSPSAYKRGQRP